MLFRDIFGDQLDDFRIDIEIFEVDRRNAVLARQEIGEPGFLYRTSLDQCAADPGSVLLLLLLRLSELLGSRSDSREPAIHLDVQTLLLRPRRIRVPPKKRQNRGELEGRFDVSNCVKS